MTQKGIKELIEENRLLKEKIAKLETVDIQKRMFEHALLQLEERFETIANSIEDFFFELDLDQRYRSIYGKGVQSIGLSERDFIGKTHSEIFGKDVGRLQQRAFKKAIKGKTTVYEWGIQGEEEKKFYQTSLCPIRDKKGEIIGIVGVGSDITNKKIMNDVLIQEKKADLVALLSGGIAHDFNNILTIIKGNCFLAKLNISQGNLDRVENIIDELDDACSRAKQLTEQLLTFSKKGTPVTETVCIEELVRDTVEFSLSGSNVVCRYEFDDNISPVSVNEGQIGQVLNNIVINATHAMENGGEIKVSVKNFTKSRGSKVLPKGEYVCISIKDSGIGIPRKYLEKIFDPYFTTKQKGHGLGLAMAYSIINKHGGYLTAESKMGFGTTFFIYLPASSSQIKEKELNCNDNISFGKGKILIMDDNETIRDILQKMLKYLGYQVFVAEDGLEAIEIYEEQLQEEDRIDLVILDLTVPGGMGAQVVIKRLLSLDPDVKALVTSGYQKNKVMSNYHEYGFKGAILKPFKLGSVSKTIHEIINKGNVENGPDSDRAISLQ